MRKITVELHVLFKVIFAIFVLLHNLDRYLLIQWICIYSVVETILYILGLIFLSDTYAAPSNAKRSMLLIILNYIEVTLGFAIIYKGMNLIVKPESYQVISENMVSTISLNSSVAINNIDIITNNVNSLEAVYYSFITSTTVGYGEYLPNGSLGQAVVIAQVFVMLIFLILFINYYSNILSENRKNRKQRVEMTSIDNQIQKYIKKSKEWTEDNKADLLKYMKYIEHNEKEN